MLCSAYHFVILRLFAILALCIKSLPRGAPTERARLPRWQNDADVQSKKVCIMQDKYNFFRQGGPRPTKEQMLHTKLFYQNAIDIYARFDEWKDNDRFYFTPLFLEMTYSMGWVAEIAPDPVWMGSFVRCTLEHPELFQFKCPECGETVSPYRFVGSPLSGRVDLEGFCKCGWKGYESVSGWRQRAIVLRDQVARDRVRYTFSFGCIKFKTVDEMLKQLAVL